MLRYSHREDCLRYVSIVLVLMTLAVATACSAPEETSTTSPSAAATSAAPHISYPDHIVYCIGTG